MISYQYLTPEQTMPKAATRDPDHISNRLFSSIVEAHRAYREWLSTERQVNSLSVEDLILTRHVSSIVPSQEVYKAFLEYTRTPL